MAADDRCSYLYGRDPSIDPRYRPRPDIRINLFGEISEESSESSRGSIETVPNEIPGTQINTDFASVYLRLRPTSKQSPHYSIENNVLKTQISESNPVAHNKNTTEKHYTFSQIFKPNASQADVYNNCIHSAIENNENFSVLTYGVSGSGKTHTILGQHEHPGIIPRAIEHIFNRYQGNIVKQPIFKIDRGSVTLLEDNMVQAELIIRKKLLKECSDGADIYYAQRSIIHDEHKFNEIVSAQYVVVWISFVEIYNENVYDLLRSSSADGGNKENANPKQRNNLKIIINDGNVFIKNLTTINVASSEEAYQLLKLGLSRVSYASTNINSNSSRSHCIFFMDLITFSDVEQLNVTSYRFCDLAGSERLKKTENTGCRLKEAQRINNSLMVLGRCLDAVYHNQLKKKNELVPTRDSKLTMLLQAPLLGRERITMIVNMLATHEYFEENFNVLNFASIAKQIVYKKLPQDHKSTRRSRFSFFRTHLTLANSSSPKYYNSTVNTSTENSILLDENYRLKTEIEELKRHIENMKSKFEEDEMQIRQEILTDWQAALKSTKDTSKKQIARREETIKREYEFKINNIEKTYNKKINQLEERLEKYEQDESKKINKLNKTF